MPSNLITVLIPFIATLELSDWLFLFLLIYGGFGVGILGLWFWNGYLGLRISVDMVWGLWCGALWIFGVGALYKNIEEQPWKNNFACLPHEIRLKHMNDGCIQATFVSQSRAVITQKFFPQKASMRCMYVYAQKWLWITCYKRKRQTAFTGRNQAGRTSTIPVLLSNS